MSALDLAPWRNDILAADTADWVTVAAYCLAALLAACATGSAKEGREKRFWKLCAALMLALAVNEIFDFQMLLTALGKSWAYEVGVYDQRRTIQLAFILALVATTALGLAGAVALTRGMHRAVRLALIGLALLAAFIMLRAASFHHADAVLGIGPDRFNLGTFQELAGIAIVAVAALVYWRR